MYNQTNLLNDSVTVDNNCTNNSLAELEVSFEDIFSGNIVHIDTESLEKIHENLEELQEEVEQNRIKIQQSKDELEVMVDAGNFLLNINSTKQEKK